MEFYIVSHVNDEATKEEIIGVYFTQEDAETAYADNVLTPRQHREMLQEFGRVVWGHCGYEMTTITAEVWYENGIW